MQGNYSIFQPFFAFQTVVLIMYISLLLLLESEIGADWLEEHGGELFEVIELRGYGEIFGYLEEELCIEGYGDGTDRNDDGGYVFDYVVGAGESVDFFGVGECFGGGCSGLD